MTRFTPGPDTAQDFRNALGSFATGVTVVTCHSPHGPLGMTVNSFTSVSLDPPLVLWCPAKSSLRHQAFTETTSFAIHMLADNQHDLCMRFANEGFSFDGVELDEGHPELPVLSGCLAVLECERHAVHDGGDHAIVVGRVTGAIVNPGEPLLFSKGRFGAFDNS